MKKLNTLLMLVLSIFIASCKDISNTSKNHTHSYTIQKAESKNLAKKATCLSAASYYYLCSCGQSGLNTFTYGEKDPSNHEKGTVYLTTDKTHKQIYECCEKVVVNEENHYGGVATCESHAICEVCEKEYGEYGDHDYKEVVDEKYLNTSATCLKEATYFKSCSCGEISNELFTYGEKDPSNHEKVATWSTTKRTHKKTYECCGEDEIKEENHTGGVATCTSLAICEKCNSSYGNFGKHEYKEVVLDKFLKEEATCLTPKTYYKSCTCGEISTETFTFGELDLNNHEYEGTWDITQNTHKLTYECCNKVEIDEENHYGGVASCTERAHCAVCDKEYGSYGDHEFNEVVNKIFLKTEANCQNGAVYYKSCKCYTTTDETFTYGEKDPSNHLGPITYERNNTLTHTVIYSCCNVSYLENHKVEDDFCSICGYYLNDTGMASEDWITYIESFKDFKKLANVSLEVTSKKEKVDTTTNEITLIKLDEYNVATSRAYNLIREKGKTTENNITQNNEIYYKYEDPCWYSYSSIGDSYFMKDIYDSTSTEISIYQELLDLDYFIHSDFSKIIFDESSQTYYYDDDNGTKTTYAFKNMELYSIKVEKEINGYKYTETYIYNFNYNSKIQLSEVSTAKGKTITKEDLDSIKSKLNENEYLKKFFVSSEETMSYSGKTLIKTIEVYGDKENSLIYEDTVTKGTFDTTNITTSENTRKYIYFGEEGKSKGTEINYDFTTLSWKEGKTTEDDYWYTIDNMDLISSLTVLEYDNLIYNELYGAYNSIESGAEPFLYYFNNDGTIDLKGKQTNSLYFINMEKHFDFNSTKTLTNPLS